MRASKSIPVLAAVGAASLLCSLGLNALAAPPSPPALEVAPGGEDVNRSVKTAEPPAVADSRQRLEDGMASIGKMASKAVNSGDLVRAACVEDKRDSANGVLQLATGEMLVINGNESAQAKAFAQEKLGAAADRMDGLVQEAQSCAGDTSPEDVPNETNNEMDAPYTAPPLDPSLGLGDARVPPAVDVQWLPVASPII